MKRRFDNIGGEEYELFKLVCPHVNELEKLIGITINEYFKNKNNKIKILEIGPGHGFTTDSILKYNSEVTIDAVDNSKVMLKHFETIFNKKIKERIINPIYNDAVSYIKSQEDESYDCVVSGLTIHNFNQREKYDTFKETYRVLKKGGIFVNGDKIARNNYGEHMRDLQWQINQFFNNYIPLKKNKLLDYWLEHYLTDNKEDKIIKEKDIIENLYKLGFKDLENNPNPCYRKHMESLIIMRK